MNDLACNGKVLPLATRTALMGILNVTPDSFSDGGAYYADVQKAVAYAGAMLNDGADIIDIGGESTRPGATPVALDDEISRVIPAVQAVRAALGDGFVVSVDTYKAEVARLAIDAGADMVNHMGPIDREPALAELLKATGVPVIICSTQGPGMSAELTAEVAPYTQRFFEQQVHFAQRQGIARSQVVLDPGIGFRKTIEQNLELIRRLRTLAAPDLPIVIGVSRKGHLARLLKEALGLETLPGVNERVEAALAETAVAVLNGAAIVRTHDVRQTRRFLVVLDTLYRGARQ